VNRDARSKTRLELDALDASEIASYRSGVWLTSRALVGTRRTDDVTLMAELSARLLIAAEEEQRA